MEVHNDLGSPPEPGIDQYDFLFHEQDRNVRTPVTTAFFSFENLRYVLHAIGLETGRRLNRCVQVLANNEFFIYLEQLLRGAVNLVDVALAVRLLNQQVIAHEVEEQYRSLRRRELFFKWYIFKDRPLTIEPPLLTHGRHREEPLSSTAYTTEGPQSRYWDSFRAQQQALRAAW